MKNKWKIGLLTSLLLTPAAIALADAPSEEANQADVERAIQYFESLHVNSSMADEKLYTTLLNKAFVNPSGNEYNLLIGKLDYIKNYQAQKLLADSLKTEIAKLTLTNNALLTNYGEAKAKYDALILKIDEDNTKLSSLKAKVTNPKYENILKNIESNYKQLATERMTDLIGLTNQNLLATRGTQVWNIGESKVADRIQNLYNTTLASNYKSLLNDVKTAYATLTTDEKTIVDNQVIPNTSVTYKQVVQNAEQNITKAAQFDAEIAKLTVIQGTDPTSLANLRTQLATIDKSYNALTPFQKELIDANSKAFLDPFAKLLEISGMIAALKPDATKEYRDAIDHIDSEISTLTSIPIGSSTIPANTVQQIVPNIDKLNGYKTDLEAVKAVENKIDGLKGDEKPTAAEVQAARTAFNALSSAQKKLVQNSNFLVAWENAEKNAAAVDKKIDAIVISNKEDFYKKYDAAKEAYEKLIPEIEVPYMKKESRFLALAPYAEFVKEYYSLQKTDPSYSTKLIALLTRLQATDNNVWSDEAIAATIFTEEEKSQLKLIRDTLLDQRSSTEKATFLVEAINSLPPENQADLLQVLVDLRTQYNNLDASSKKLVTNIKQLTAYEKTNKKALDFMRLVNQLDPLDASFVKDAEKARKNYNSLNQAFKNLVTKSLQKLEQYEKVSNVMADIDKLQKSKNILEDARNAEENLNALINNLPNDDFYQNIATEIITILENTYKDKVELAKKRQDDVTEVINQINRLESEPNDVGTWIKSISDSYKALSSNDKKLVSNYKTFKLIEKNYKAAAKVYDLIENLPSKESVDYAKKIDAALKAYRKLTPEQAKYVTNYSTKLEPFITVAALIGDIESLKPSMKDYKQAVEQLRLRYDALTEADKRQIYNYNKLVAAEESLKGPTNVIQLINEARPGVEDYLNKLITAREAYDALDSNQKKQVTNYKTLQDREKAVKPVLTLQDLIEKVGLQSTAKNFIRNYEKAQKQYENINLQDRILLTNETLLTQTYVPLYNVMKRIESIKPTSNSFVQDVKAAREAYNALTAEQKAKILNEDTLRGHELNVDGGAKVDELIRALKSNPPEVYVQKVKEAEAAYKALSSTNKKAVTLYPELQVELKFIAPVVKAMNEIDKLATVGDKLASQVSKVQSALSKLSDEQFALIPNMDKYYNLENVIHVVGLIELIKPSDTKYYIGNTKAAEIAYNRLSPDEKQRVTNYTKLEEALMNVQALDQITKKISELSIFSNTYVDDVNQLLLEYKNLPSALKKQVSNYSKLEQAKKDIDAAEKVMKAIREIDPNVRTFESKVESAKKAYDKLTEEQRNLVTNARLLQQYISQLGL